MFLFRPYFQNFTNLILKQSHSSLFRPSIPTKTKSVSDADQTDDMAAISHAISLISCFKLKIQTINKKWVFFFFLFFFFFLSYHHPMLATFILYRPPKLENSPASNVVEQPNLSSLYKSDLSASKTKIHDPTKPAKPGSGLIQKSSSPSSCCCPFEDCWRQTVTVPKQ